MDTPTTHWDKLMASQPFCRAARRRTVRSCTAGLLSIAAAASTAEPNAPAAPARKLGEHPAIVARRVIAAQGYDYASKFYPHPAWLYLSAEAPRGMMEQPAVPVLHRAEQEGLAALEAAAAAPVKP
jgi:hypothetical protein